MLHQMISGDQFDGVLMQGAAHIGFENIPLGVRYRVVKDQPNGNSFVRHAECIVPNAFLIPNIREAGTKPKRKERCTELSWAVPVDNEHVRGLSIAAWPLGDGEPKKDWRPGTDMVHDIRPGSALSRTYEDRQRKPNDPEAQEGQRPIAIHTLENLATSDMGIVLLRRALREQIKRMRHGFDPINVMREARFNQRIPTDAWNTLWSLAEASVHQGEEV
jgi:hypothetical protein